MGRVTSRSYNARGQETSDTLPDPDGAGPLTAPVFTKAFNARGELVSQADAMGNITSWTYNAQGQALTQTDPDPDGAGPLPAAVTTFTYDLRGLRSSVTDASGNTTSYGYDHAGRLVEEIDPRGNSSYYQYDVAGQVTRVVDRNSRKRDFTYNDLGLVTEEVWVDGFGNTVKTIAHGYDDAGREVSVSDGVTAYQYQYDLAGRASQVDNAGSVVPEVTLSMAYDYEGNRTWLGDNLGGGISYAWNNQRLQSMVMYTENYKSAQVGFGYDSVGRLSSLTRTANWNCTTTINTTFTLDLLDRVTSITHSKGMGEDASTLSQFTYGYDASGRVTNYTGPEGSLSYALDANGQLLSVTGSRTDNYAFDANGNRTSNSTAAGNLLLNDGKYSYTYDLEGNQKTKTRISDGQVTEFFWDYRNQLTKAMVKDANGVLLKELRFTYDVEGRRVGEWVDADGAGPEEPDQVWTVFDGVNPYMDFDGDGLLKTRYLYGPGIDELFARIGTGEDPQWYLADRLGSVRQIVDASGAILDEITYDSFGNVLSEGNPSQGDRFKFTGREYSPELGIYYYRARWYDPGSGRFISQDPIGFSAGDVNLYRYVGNAPGDATDPEGLEGPWRGYPYGPKDVPPKPVSFGWITSVGNFLYEGMDLVFLEPIRMGGDLLRAGEFGVENYFGWNPNEPDWRSRLARDVSQGDKSNRDIFFDHEKENIVRGACLIGGKVAGDFLGKTFRWLQIKWTNGPNWRLGSNHSATQWANKIAKRGWTPQQISEAIANGQRFPAVNLVNPGNPASRYIHPTTGRSVIVDNVTGEIIHVGADGFLF